MNLEPPRATRSPAPVRVAPACLVLLVTLTLAACSLVPPPPQAQLPPEQFRAVEPPLIPSPDARDIATDGSRVVVVGRAPGSAPGPQFGLSDDGGATWRPGSLTEQAQAEAGPRELPSHVAYSSSGGAPHWVALGQGPRASLAWVSEDGEEWSRHPLSGLDLRERTWTRPVHDPQVGFVLATSRVNDTRLESGEPPELWRSEDGVDWRPLGATVPGPAWVRDVAVHGRTVVAAGLQLPADDSELEFGPVVWVSPDAGGTWQRATLPALTGRWADGEASFVRVVWLGDRFVATGSIGPWREPEATFVAESADGLAWSLSDLPEADGRELSGQVLERVGDATLLGLGRTWNGTDDVLLMRRGADGAWTRSRTPAEPHGSVPLRLVGAVSVGGAGLVLVDHLDAGSRSPVWRTTDGGASFVEVDGPVPAAAPFVDPRMLVSGGAVGHSSGMPAFWPDDGDGFGSPVVIGDPTASITGAADGGPGTLVWGLTARGRTQVWLADGTRFATVADPVLSPGGDAGTTLTDVIVTGSGWLAVGTRTDEGVETPLVATSPDGRAWSPVDVAAGDRSEGEDGAAADEEGPGRSGSIAGVTAHDDGFVAVGETGGRPSWWRGTPEGAWTRHDLPAPEASRTVVLDVASNGSRLVVLGRTQATPDTAWRTLIWTSGDDGATWSSAPLGPDAGVGARRLVVVGQTFVVLQATRDLTGVDAYAGTDGVQWRQLEWPVTIDPATDARTVYLLDARPREGAVDVLVRIEGRDASRSVVERLAVG